MLNENVILLFAIFYKYATRYLLVFDAIEEQKGKTLAEKDCALQIYKIGSHKTFYVKL